MHQSYMAHCQCNEVGHPSIQVAGGLGGHVEGLLAAHTRLLDCVHLILIHAPNVQLSKVQIQPFQLFNVFKFIKFFCDFFFQLSL